MYDVIVVGLGSMGSSALYYLAKAGVKVLGIEQYGIVHKNGSHSGQSRIVRKAYFEHPDYVPLLDEAYKGWNQLEADIGEKLFQKTGLIYFGNPTHPVMNGVRKSSEQYQISLSSDVHSAYQKFTLPTDFDSFLEPEAGFVLTDKTICSLIKLAKKHKAKVQIDEKVIQIDQSNDQLKIITDRGSYKTKKLVISSGAYIDSLIDVPQIKVNITRQLISWIEPKKSKFFELGNFPCWMISDTDYPGLFYGFPIMPIDKYGNNGWLKVAHHTAGVPINPNEVNQYDSVNEKEKIVGILQKYLPCAIGEIKSISSCMYTNSLDENFIIDFLPESNGKIVVATGFSGHGFKFVPVIGKILKELALEGKTDQPIGFLSLNRFKS